MSDLPTVTIVFLVYNRRDELRISLRQMLEASDYPSELVDVIVVDNASADGSAEMVRQEFPQVQLIRREVNCGVSGWNDGFAVARGELVLALDDDCYLPPDGLRRAVLGAREHGAHLVSFGVVSSVKPDHRFDRQYRTGLLSFWGCAVLMRREVLQRLEGYDPDIFVWANELELMLRFFDAGFRHLHAPEIVAVHMKDPGRGWPHSLTTRAYRINAEHFAYVAAKQLRPRDALATLLALLVNSFRDSYRGDRRAAHGVRRSLWGFLRGARRRAPVAPHISRVYRQNFTSFASPWWLSRPPLLFLRELPRAALRRLLRRPRRPAAHPGRAREYFEQRAAYYPTAAATLEL